jgi:ubiquinone biosynthesis protein UbiJ
MDEAPDLTSLARRCLDLWQEQVSALAGDPAVADQFARLLGLLEGGAAAWWQAAAAVSRGKTDGDGSGGTATSSGPAGSATAPLSPAAGGDDLARLAARLGALEERLARLESGAGGGAHGARGGPRAGRPRRPRGGDR